MERILKYIILPTEKLIVEYLGGKANWIDYLEMKKKEVADTNYNGSYSVLTDISDVDTKYTREMEGQIMEYINYLTNQKIELNHLTSIITNSPTQYLHSEFLKKHSQKINIKVQIFSTQEAAFNWIRLNPSEHANASLALRILRDNDE
ncbi:MAG: hypothetical protein JXA77_03930 [Bacteroidales bacterium]|nr:hypothetical protein [Bacteroidales bacterium]MBN2820339.1 hypothetical protein [Bacteroidales bacterium]